MASEEKGGCSMIVSPEGKILCDMGAKVGSACAEVEPKHKYMRPAGFGGGLIRNDDFINNGLCPGAFSER